MSQTSDSARAQTDKPQSEKKKPSLFHLIISVLAAAVGVQNKKNLEEDFASSSPMPYIIAGVLFTAAFVFTLIFIVKWVLSS